MDGQAARVAEVGDVVEQLQRIDEAAARGGAAGQLEADQAAEAALQIGVGAAPALAVLQRREDHLDDVAVPFEELGHGHGIAAMLANAQRQRLQPLQEQEGVEGAERVAEVALQRDARLEDVGDRKSTRLNSRHYCASRMPSSA